MEPADQKLWNIAKKRVAFRKSLYSYLVVVGFLWAIWWFTIGRKGIVGVPWPIWVMLGWGVGLVIQYLDAYRGDDETLAQREFDRLKKNNRL